MRRRPAVLLLVVGLLASCTQRTDSTAGGAQAPDGDIPVSSSMVEPVGGDLRTGEPWYLVGGMLESPTPSPVRLTFRAGTLAGKGPVNSYSADFTASPTGDLEIGPFTSTWQAGPDREMRAEAEILGLLDAVDGYTTVAGGELYLFDGDLNVLVYASTPPSDAPSVTDATQAVAQEIIGMSEAAARSAVEDADLTLRVVARDGDSFAVTDDYSVTRINATLVEGVVSETTIG